MDLTRVIIKPYNTEKTYLMTLEEQKKYSFIVDKNASKKLIADAFEVIYGVRPEKVNVINRKPTSIRTGTRVPGIAKAKRIAYITLPKGLDIVLEEDDVSTTETSKNDEENK